MRPGDPALPFALMVLNQMEQNLAIAEMNGVFASFSGDEVRLG